MLPSAREYDVPATDSIHEVNSRPWQVRTSVSAWQSDGQIFGAPNRSVNRLGEEIAHLSQRDRRDGDADPEADGPPSALGRATTRTAPPSRLTHTATSTNGVHE